MTRPVLMPAVLGKDRPVDGAQLLRWQGETMGTYWRVQAAACADPSRQDLILQEVTHLLAQVCQEMSHWDPASELSAYGRAEAQSWHPVSEHFAAVMRCALEVARLTQGAYDPSAAPWINAWGFGANHRFDAPGFQAPTLAQCEALRPTLIHSWRDVRLAQAPHTRLWQPGGVSLDLGAVAKGYAVDAVSRLLVAHGLPHHLVEIGGELRGEGVRPDGQPWWVNLELPSAMGMAEAGLDESPLLALHGLSVATSGDYRRYFEIHGQRLSHTIDPRTGRPVAHGPASVTVVHRDCMWADAWSTAIAVLGVDEGLALADALKLAAFVIHRDGDVLTPYASTAFEAMLE